MEKIVNITHYVSKANGVSSARPLIAAVADSWTGDRTEKTRGNLLQFPSPYMGPLSAA